MFTDMNGVRRYKINLHTHTTVSDGHLSPEEAVRVYARHGYDMVALTDHWTFSEAAEYDIPLEDGSVQHIRVLPGCEYNACGGDSGACVYHVVALGCSRVPDLDVSLNNADTRPVPVRTREILDRVHEAGGFAVLAHPAWSLNSCEQMMSMLPYEATEIYNSVSDWGMSDRPYSGLVVDELAAQGVYLPLLATDDTHYYDGDECRGWIMAEADAVDSLGLYETIRQNKFYATMGPEIHLEWLDENTVKLSCSPVCKIAFLSHMVWTAGRMVRGDGLTEAVYTLKNNERYIRAEVTDAAGRVAFSPILVRK